MGALEAQLGFNPQERSLELREIMESWLSFSAKDRKNRFTRLERHDQEELFLFLSAADQLELLEWIPILDQRTWLRLLAPDDTADLIQRMPEEDRKPALKLLDPQTKSEVKALLAYREDQAGGRMNSRFVRVRPNMMIDEAITYIRAQAATDVEIPYYAYVLDFEQRLLGIISYRDILMSPNDKRIWEIMVRDVKTLADTLGQEEMGRQFSQSNWMAMPVVDREGRMKGIVTADDAIRAMGEEATKDIQKLGGTEALDAPYLKIALLKMVRKRAGWLVVLFLSEMLTASAMGVYQKEIEKAVVLALFIPLIISSGGNSGSQASTLIIRAMALGEVKLRDGWRVFFRELSSGLFLGVILGGIGLLRILLWPTRRSLYGEHYVLVAATVSLSLVGIVLWGSLAGSLLPLLLKRLGFDPASACAPFVATLVDVTGLMIYFSVASLVLRGTLL